MTYEKGVCYKIELVDAVLDSLNVSPLFANSDFSIDQQFHHEHYVKFLLRKPNCVNLELILVGNAFQVNIDRANEALEWSEKQILDNPTNVKDTIKMLFTSKINVEHCGHNYTKIFFYDGNGLCVKTLKYVTGLYLKMGCEMKEFSPIYR